MSGLPSIRARADGRPWRFYARLCSRWLTTFCDQWQTQMRMQCLADHQALADGDPFRVVADCGLEER